MATSEEKHELVKRLKFNPTVYTLELTGSGAEVVIGKANEDAYEFFEEQAEMSLVDYATDFDEESVSAVPEDAQIFQPGEFYDCDHFFHETGVWLDSWSRVRVFDQNNETIWESDLDETLLKNQGVTIEIFSKIKIKDIKYPYVFYGEQGESGEFFAWDFPVNEPFDPTKLTLTVEDVDGIMLCNYGKYGDYEFEDGMDSYSTAGDGIECVIIKTGNEEE
jgi:hypothetical protein